VIYGSLFKWTKIAPVYRAGGSSVSDISFEYVYNETSNPAATVQSITERLKNYAKSETINNLTTTVNSLNILYLALQDNLSIAQSSIIAINEVLPLKQDVIVIDGNYNAETNKVATVDTVVTKATEIAAKKIAEWVADAPESYDTLKEIAQWINDHPNSVGMLNDLIQQNARGIISVSDKVDKINKNITEINTNIDNTNKSIEDIKKGETSVKKAECDNNGNNIAETYAKKGVSGTYTIQVDSWDNTLKIEGIIIDKFTENDAIFFTPATMYDKIAAEGAELFISTNGALITFECGNRPRNSINLQFFIVRGGG
jgi:hypothetical protein